MRIFPENLVTLHILSWKKSGISIWKNLAFGAGFCHIYIKNKSPVWCRILPYLYGNIKYFRRDL